jgi:hypothetical protein
MLWLTVMRLTREMRLKGGDQGPKGKDKQKKVVLQDETKTIRRAEEEVSVSTANTEAVHDWEKHLQSA